MANDGGDARSRSSSRDSTAEGESQQQASRRHKVEFALDRAGVAEASAFVAPAGLKKASSNGVALTEFDLQSLERRLSNGCELWAVRLPDGTKLRHLAETTLSIPNDARSAIKMGNVTIKKAEYDIVQAGTAVDGDSTVSTAGEMRNFVALCPTQRGTAYTPVKANITRCVVLQQRLQLDQAETVSAETAAATGHAQHACDRFLQPAGLNGFFRPSGFDTAPDFSKIAPSHAALRPVVTVASAVPNEGSAQKKRKKDKTQNSPVASIEVASTADASVASTLAPVSSGSAVKAGGKKAKKHRISEGLGSEV